MSFNDQNQAPTAALDSNPPSNEALPPVGYPTKDEAALPKQAPVVTKSRGDGFWKGCCAALCCCCVLESCF